MQSGELKLYNTMTRSKAAFTPLDANNVRMYVCGPTVYDFAHIGNARPVIVFDLLFRLLKHLAALGVWDGGKGETNVTYVRNITDVDDKINARAARDFPGLPLNEAIRKVTEKTANQYQKDVIALGNLEPTFEPRATEHIPGMIKMIQALIDKGHAYVAQGNEGREALFDVLSMSNYGALSKRKLEDQQAGARVAVDAHKRNPEDFVLWKESAAHEPGWDATFFISDESKKTLRLNSNEVLIYGRPGWHIECSAMSAAYLGTVFDIHGGGLDLIFPHHENEIAQSRCAHGTDRMANVWMHNGFLQVEGQKMSKSLGNFFTIAELLETEKFGGRKWPGEVLRLAMLMTNYREPIDFSVKRLEEARAIWSSFAQVVRDYSFAPEIDADVMSALADDLDTSEAIRRLIGLRKAAVAGDILAGRRLLGSLRLLGFFQASYGLKTTIHYPDVDLRHVTVDEFVTANTNLADDVPVSVVTEQVDKSHPNDGKHIVNDLRKFQAGTLWVELRDFRENLGFSSLEQAIASRLAALNAKNFAEADRIRGALLEQGVQLMDSKNAAGERVTKWESVR